MSTPDARSCSSRPARWLTVEVRACTCQGEASVPLFVFVLCIACTSATRLATRRLGPHHPTPATSLLQRRLPRPCCAHAPRPGAASSRSSRRLSRPASTWMPPAPRAKSVQAGNGLGVKRLTVAPGRSHGSRQRLLPPRPFFSTDGTSYCSLQRSRAGGPHSGRGWRECQCRGRGRRNP